MTFCSKISSQSSFFFIIIIIIILPLSVYTVTIIFFSFACLFFLCACVNLDLFMSSHRHRAILIFRLIVSSHRFIFICNINTSSLKVLLFFIARLSCRISSTASTLKIFLMKFSIFVERNLGITPPGLCLFKPKTNRML